MSARERTSTGCTARPTGRPHADRRRSAASFARAAALCTAILAAAAQGAAGFPQIALRRIAGGFASPIGISVPGDGSGRIFVVEQNGRIMILKDGAPLPAPFLDITDRVIDTGERGLLSAAFPPGYASKGYFYVDYTAASPPVGHTVVSRFRATADPDIADPSSEEVILTVDQPFANHNGGLLLFGPRDGLLYVGLGDGGGAGDPLGNAQDLGSLLGKILRIDVESGAAPYAIPPSNPFAGAAGARGEIWAWGLRNPWRFSFDRATGDLYIGDVGQNTWEEIDFQPASSAGGENYGWNIMEGNHCFPAPPCTPPPDFVTDIFEYNHSDGDHSVTGGFVYRGNAFPGLQGVYLFADFVSGRFGGLRRTVASTAAALLLSSSISPSSFGEDEHGELYVAGYADGAIYRIEAVQPVPDVTVNGSDGPLTLPPSDTAVVAVGLDPANRAGAQADWWAAASTPSGLLWFDGGAWTPRQTPARQGPLFSLAPTEIARAAGLSPGAYTVFFGVDLARNGILDDTLFVDAAEVRVR